MKQARGASRRIILVVLLILVLGAIGALVWKQSAEPAPSDRVILLGTTDIRESHLAFRVADRLAKMHVDEGDSVDAGQVLAELDTTLIRANLDEAEAMADSASQTFDRLKNGARPEEIQRARAVLAEAQALADDAKSNLADTLEALRGNAVSQREVDAATAKSKAAEARVQAASAELALLLDGSRKEDIAAADAAFRAATARVAIARQALTDAQLVAPFAGIIRTRLREPGEMVGPSTPVLLLAETDPKWVRVYIDEADLGRTKLGMPAVITIDAYPDREFSGWLGSISPTAEFTPKPVATERLRTSLVYQARVFVRDPDGIFKLGMPATVTLTPGDSAPESTHEPKP